jgi:hypothetical protein
MTWAVCIAQWLHKLIVNLMVGLYSSLGLHPFELILAMLLNSGVYNGNCEIDSCTEGCIVIADIALRLLLAGFLSRMPGCCSSSSLPRREARDER